VYSITSCLRASCFRASCLRASCLRASCFQASCLRYKRTSVLGVSRSDLSIGVTFTGIHFCQNNVYGFITSATEEIERNGFHHAIDLDELDFSVYHSAESSGISCSQSHCDFRRRHRTIGISVVNRSRPVLSNGTGLALIGRETVKLQGAKVNCCKRMMSISSVDSTNTGPMRALGL